MPGAKEYDAANIKAKAHPSGSHSRIDKDPLRFEVDVMIWIQLSL